MSTAHFYDLESVARFCALLVREGIGFTVHDADGPPYVITFSGSF